MIGSAGASGSVGVFGSVGASGSDGMAGVSGSTRTSSIGFVAGAAGSLLDEELQALASIIINARAMTEITPDEWVDDFMGTCQTALMKCKPYRNHTASAVIGHVSLG